MSQAGIINASGIPTAATTYVTDAGVATPALNVLNIVTQGAGLLGIQTAAAGNVITITTTPAAVEGGITTIDAITADPVVMNLGALPATYCFNIIVTAFSNTNSLGAPSPPVGAGYGIVAAVRTTGVVSTLIPNQAIDEMEEAALIPCDASVVVVGNSAIIRVTGVLGLTVQWNVVAQYTYV